MIRNILKRNKPIMIVGVLLLITFIVIIAIAQKGPKKSPGLVEVPKTDETLNEQSIPTSDVIDRVREGRAGGNTNNSETTAAKPDIDYTAADQKYGTLQIDYTQSGFSSKYAKVFVNRLVKWTNKTAKNITFVQLMPSYEELKTPFIIKAGESFEFRMTKLKLWTYKEQETGNYGTIFVEKDVTNEPVSNQP